MPPLAQSSGSGLTFLIYLIVGVFWLVGNLLQSKKAKQKALEMRKKREEREAEEKRTGKKVVSKQTTIERELESYLGRLTGQPPPPSPPPMPKPKQTPRENPSFQNSDIQFDGPAPTRSPLADPPVAASKNYDIGDLDMEASFKQMSEMKEAVELEEGASQLQQEALANVRSMMIDLSSSSISVPVVSLKSIRAIQTRVTHPNLSNRKTFKQAAIASVLLAPPKALQADPFQQTPLIDGENST